MLGGFLDGGKCWIYSYTAVVWYLKEYKIGAMSKTGKVAVTVLLIVGFFIVGIFLQAAGISKALLGMLALGVFYGIRTMWKKPKEESPNKEIILDKSDSDSNITKK